MTNVLIVDDERMVQELFTYYISKASNRYRLVSTIKGALNAEAVCMRSPVDLILMDICTNNSESGLEAAEIIKKNFPNIKIIMVTSMPEVSFIKKARVAGAESFWYKEVSPESLINVMDRTMAGERVYPDATPNISVGLAKTTDFTPTELKVLYYIVQGKSIGEIAELMNVAYETTRTHIKNLKVKTGAGSIAALAALAAGTRLVLPEY